MIQRRCENKVKKRKGVDVDVGKGERRGLGLDRVVDCRFVVSYRVGDQFRWQRFRESRLMGRSFYLTYNILYFLMLFRLIDEMNDRNDN